MNPGLPISWNTLGVALYTLEGPAAALDAWEKAVALDPALYDALSRLQPSPIVELNRAVALGRAFGPEAGLALLDEIKEHAAAVAEVRHRDLRLLRAHRLDVQADEVAGLGYPPSSSTRTWL